MAAKHSITRQVSRATGLPIIDFSAADLQGLLTIYDTLSHARNAITGGVNQPRAEHGNAEAFLDRLSCYFDDMMESVVEAAKALKPSNTREREWRAEILIREAMHSDEWDAVLTAAARAISAEH